MRRRGIFVLAFVAALGGLAHRDVWAHAGARLTDPIDGATLGDTPSVVRLSFSERPEASLSTIRVVDIAGVAYHAGRPESSPGDPLTLSVRLKPLERGVYIVNWRTVSAIDGHATAGSYAFGVRVAPTSMASATLNPAASPFEMLARWVLIAGLVLLLGAAAAGVARFGGRGGLALGAAGTMVALLGVALLAEAQRRNAAASFADLLNTSVGQALIWRAGTIGAAGAALALVPRAHFPLAAMTAAALAAIAAMTVHVAAGHAAAGSGWPLVAAVGTQSVHFAAVGIWLGGLAALLTGIRGAPSDEKTAAVRRFSTIAAGALLVVAATGVARSAGELSSWEDLVSSGYGRGVLVKSALLVAVAVFGAVNRWRSVPAAATTLRPLRRLGRVELALAAGALAAAAVLGTLAPPISALPLGLTASGVDFGTTVRVGLTTGSVQPGPNRFTITALDYDSRTPVRARRVSLRFTPLDDPAIAPTTLLLSPGPDNAYVGSGANLAFEGRWRVTVLIERTADSVEVPLDVETRSQPQFVAVLRVPGQAPQYMVEVARAGHIRFSPNPERAGRAAIDVTCFDRLVNRMDVETIVVTAAAGSGPARQAPVRRVDTSTFVADVELQPGRNRLAAVARSIDGTRLWAAVDSSRKKMRRIT